MKSVSTGECQEGPAETKANGREERALRAYAEAVPLLYGQGLGDKQA